MINWHIIGTEMMYFAEYLEELNLSYYLKVPYDLQSQLQVVFLQFPGTWMGIRSNADWAIHLVAINLYRSGT